MAVQKGIPTVFIAVILLQCVVCLDDFKPTGNIVKHESPLFPEVLTLNCINMTLTTDEYDMFPNSTLYVKKYDMLLNSTAYVQTNDSIAICRPKWVMLLDKLTVGFYFAFIIFMTHAQTPLALCFGGLSRLYLTFVLCMPVATLFSIGIASTYSEFVEKCVVTMAVLTFINVSTLGWMTLLSSNYIVRFLESRYCIVITETKIVLKKLTSIAHMGLVLATILSGHSFVMILCGVVKKLYDVDFIDKIEGGKMLILFAPPIMLFFVINFMLSFLNYNDYSDYDKSTNGTRQYIRYQHRKYFVMYLGSICSWLVGSYAFTFNFWTPWYFFVAINILLLIFWVNEFLSFNMFVYDIPEDYPVEDDGYTVLFTLGKRVLKLDFDYSAAGNLGLK